MKLARHCTSITHLLFEDDSLFFCRAEASDCNRLANILEKYEKVLGQKVNYNQYSLIFGKRIPVQMRQQLHHILKIDTTRGVGKYLGLTEQFGRSKVRNFSYFVDRVKRRLEPWYNRYLSQAGKEVLIKSILQSVPVYSMSCFLLPKTVCDEIHLLLANFWWGKNCDKRKIPWVSWKRLYLPKKEGGMGFRDLYSFNKALLAKQA